MRVLDANQEESAQTEAEILLHDFMIHTFHASLNNKMRRPDEKINWRMFNFSHESSIFSVRLSLCQLHFLSVNSSFALVLPVCCNWNDRNWMRPNSKYSPVWPYMCHAHADERKKTESIEKNHRNKSVNNSPDLFKIFILCKMTHTRDTSIHVEKIADKKAGIEMSTTRNSASATCIESICVVNQSMRAAWEFNFPSSAFSNIPCRAAQKAEAKMNKTSDSNWKSKFWAFCIALRSPSIQCRTANTCVETDWDRDKLHNRNSMHSNNRNHNYYSLQCEFSVDTIAERSQHLRLRWSLYFSKQNLAGMQSRSRKELTLCNSVLSNQYGNPLKKTVLSPNGIEFWLRYSQKIAESESVAQRETTLISDANM